MTSAKPEYLRAGGGPSGPQARGEIHVVCLLADHFWMREHLVRSWREVAASCSVFFYDWESWQTADWLHRRRREADRFIDWLQVQRRERRIDLLFCVVYDDFMTPELARRTRALGIPMVNYHVDMQHQWYRVLRSAPYFDLLCVAHREFAEALAPHVPIAYVPMASNPRYFRPVDVPKTADVVFVGSYSPERARVLQAALEVTPHVVAYGAGWEPKSRHVRDASRSLARVIKPHRLLKLHNDLRHYMAPRLTFEGPAHIMRAKRMSAVGSVQTGAFKGTSGGFLADDQFVSAISSARIALGINQRFGRVGRRADMTIGSVTGRLRDFEVPSCGVMYLAQRYPELEVFFREGEEIDSWSSLDELQAKLSYYLGRPDAREQVARRGRERVLSDHTWESRFRHILHRLHWSGRSTLAPRS